MSISKQDITTHLSPIINEINNTDYIILYKENELTMSVTVESFLVMFQNATSFSSNDLLNVDNNTLGYSAYINDWKNKGYII